MMIILRQRTFSPKIEVYDKISYYETKKDKELCKDWFKFFLDWCKENNLLSKDGIELYEFGVDESFSLHSGMFTDRGNRFMKTYYNIIFHKFNKQLLNTYLKKV